MIECERKQIKMESNDGTETSGSATSDSFARTHTHTHALVNLAINLRVYYILYNILIYKMSTKNINKLFLGTDISRTRYDNLISLVSGGKVR